MPVGHVYAAPGSALTARTADAERHVAQPRGKIQEACRSLGRITNCGSKIGGLMTTRRPTQAGIGHTGAYEHIGIQ